MSRAKLVEARGDMKCEEVMRAGGGCLEAQAGGIAQERHRRNRSAMNQAMKASMRSTGGHHRDRRGRDCLRRASALHEPRPCVRRRKALRCDVRVLRMKPNRPETEQHRLEEQRESRRCVGGLISRIGEAKLSGLRGHSPGGRTVGPLPPCAPAPVRGEPAPRLSSEAP